MSKHRDSIDALGGDTDPQLLSEAPLSRQVFGGNLEFACIEFPAYGFELDLAVDQLDPVAIAAADVAQQIEAQIAVVGFAGEACRGPG